MRSVVMRRWCPISNDLFHQEDEQGIWLLITKFNSSVFLHEQQQQVASGPGIKGLKSLYFSTSLEHKVGERPASSYLPLGQGQF